MHKPDKASKLERKKSKINLRQIIRLLNHKRHTITVTRQISGVS